MIDWTVTHKKKMKVLALLLVLGAIFSYLTYFPTQGLAKNYGFNPDQPEHHKTISKNEDGTYTLSLDVSGDSIHKEKVRPADIVLVMDVTHSMTWSMEGKHHEATPDDPVRMEVAHDAAIKLVDEVLGKDSINEDLPEDQKTRISLVRFGSHAECNTFGKDSDKNFFISDADVLKENIDTYINKDNEISGTNWSAGFIKANEVLGEEIGRAHV